MNCSMLMLLSLEELRTLRRAGVEVSLRSTQIKPTFPLDQFCQPEVVQGVVSGDAQELNMAKTKTQNS
jgi:hypothetical protein